MIGLGEYRDVLHYTALTARLTEPERIGDVVVRGLVELVGADGGTLTHLDLRTGHEVVVQWPPMNPVELGDYPKVAASHPLRPAVRDRLQRRDLESPPLRISDVLSTREWRRTAMFALTHADVSDQMTMPVSIAGSVVRAVAVNRQRGRFDDRQREVLALTRPHVGATLDRTPAGDARGLRLWPEVGWTRLASAPGLAGDGDRASLSPVLSVDLGQLSARERSVASLVAAGHTDQQVARELGLRPATVSSHLRRIYARLGLPNRAALAAAWISRSGSTTSGR